MKAAHEMAAETQTVSSGALHELDGPRPVGVKRFQTIHDCGIDVAHGLVLLYGIGT